MFNFGDGAVAALIVAGEAPANEILGKRRAPTAPFAAREGAGGRQRRPVLDGSRFLDVHDLEGMRTRLDEVSLANFVAVAREAVRKAGADLGDIGYLCGIHMKRSMHDGLVRELGLAPDRAAYLDDTGHMSGVDPLFALDRAARAGELADGELVLLLAAGTGYTWAASVVRWGAAKPPVRERTGGGGLGNRRFPSRSRGSAIPSTRGVSVRRALSVAVLLALLAFAPTAGAPVATAFPPGFAVPTDASLGVPVIGFGGAGP